MVGTCTGTLPPTVELGALCTAFCGVNAVALYMLTGVVTGGRAVLTDAGAPSVQPAAGACVKLPDAVLLAARVWLCAGRFVAFSATVAHDRRGGR